MFHREEGTRFSRLYRAARVSGPMSTIWRPFAICTWIQARLFTIYSPGGALGSGSCQSSLSFPITTGGFAKRPSSVRQTSLFPHEVLSTLCASHPSSKQCLCPQPRLVLELLNEMRRPLGVGERLLKMIKRVRQEGCPSWVEHFGSASITEQHSSEQPK